MHLRFARPWFCRSNNILLFYFTNIWETCVVGPCLIPLATSWRLQQYNLQSHPGGWIFCICLSWSGCLGRMRESRDPMRLHWFEYLKPANEIGSWQRPFGLTGSNENDFFFLYLLQRMTLQRLWFFKKWDNERRCDGPLPYGTLLLRELCKRRTAFDWPISKLPHFYFFKNGKILWLII